MVVLGGGEEGAEDEGASPTSDVLSRGLSRGEEKRYVKREEKNSESAGKRP